MYQVSYNDQENHTRGCPEDRPTIAMYHNGTSEAGPIIAYGHTTILQNPNTKILVGLSGALQEEGVPCLKVRSRRL